MKNNILLYYLILQSANTFIDVARGGSILSFQSSGKTSIDEWAEFKGEMPHLNGITICHWDRLDYISDDVSSIWSYCTQKTTNDKMVCIQMEYKAILSRANRHMKLLLWLYNETISVDIIPFRHRTWNHCCWSYSAETNRHRIYINGKLMTDRILPPVADRSIWEGSNKVESHAFIMGQEPDKIRGGYSLDQLFIGSITELNIWNTTLKESTVDQLSKCQSFAKGNVKSWSLENLKVSKADIIEDNDLSSMCLKNKMLIMFPKRQPFRVAKNLCLLHGGKLHTPLSDEENKETMSILNKHKSQCLDTTITDSRNLGKSIWLGLKRENSVWKDITTESVIGSTLNYSNWAISNYGNNVEYAYVKSNGLWKYSNERDTLELCTLCSIENVPIFTLKGVCKESGLFYNYFLKIGDKNEVEYYEAYKTALPTENIQIQNGAWQSTGNRFSITLLSGNKTQYPIGRLKWDVIDNNCGIKEEKYLSFSRCEFGEEYSCESGHCISIEKRCNNVRDCEDNSDEMDCLTIEVPRSYRKVEPPRAHKLSSLFQYSPVETKITIKSIDEIDTLEMTMEMTIDINMVWQDGRLTYTNLLDNTRNLVDNSIMDQLWIPLDYIVHDNAVTGKIKTESNSRILSVQKLTNPLPANILDHFENLQFGGYENKLEVNQRFRIKYKCKFDLLKFPFDSQCCKFMMYLKLKPNMTLKFQNKDQGVTYIGPPTVDQFSVTKISSSTGIDEEKTWFTYSVQIHRDYMHQVISTIFPCMLLWLLSYFSLFISVFNFNNRFMGSVTILLVLVSLRGSIATDLPKTSYFKYIDLWFLWYITNIFFIISYHIIVDRFSANTITDLQSISSRHLEENDYEDVPIKILTRDQINKYAVIIFPVLTICFNLVYFTLTLQ